MKQTSRSLQEILGPIPESVQQKIDISIEISDRLDTLMRERGLNKKQVAEALGKRPSDVSKWLSGQYDFSLSTISLLSSFFGKEIINVV